MVRALLFGVSTTTKHFATQHSWLFSSNLVLIVFSARSHNSSLHSTPTSTALPHGISNRFLVAILATARNIVPRPLRLLFGCRWRHALGRLLGCLGQARRIDSIHRILYQQGYARVGRRVYNHTETSAPRGHGINCWPACFGTEQVSSCPGPRASRQTTESE